MEKLEQIMDGNELCITALRKEIERLKDKIKLVEKTLFEGYYDEIGNYVVTFNKEDLEDSLKKVFGANEIYILH